MRGIPHYNAESFEEAAEWLRHQGWSVTSPWEHDLAVMPEIRDTPEYEHGSPMSDATIYGRLLGWDLKQVCDADAIALLPGWENSVGCAHEVYVARAVNKDVYLLDRKSNSWVMRPETPPRIIGLAGYAQVGKDTIGSILVRDHGFERRAFADALKRVAYDAAPWLVAGDIRFHLQEVVGAVGWDRAKTEYPGVREYLQDLGNAVREHVGNDAWVTAALQNLVPGGRYVITDVRFPNEAAEIIRLGGEVYRVERPGYGPVNDHISETAMDSWTEYAGVIVNRGTIKDLTSEVKLLAE